MVKDFALVRLNELANTQKVGKFVTEQENPTATAVLTTHRASSKQEKPPHNGSGNFTN